MGTRCGVEEKIFQESRATLSGNVAGELSLHGDVVLLTLSDILKCHNRQQYASFVDTYLTGEFVTSSESRRESSSLTRLQFPNRLITKLLYLRTNTEINLVQLSVSVYDTRSPAFWTDSTHDSIWWAIPFLMMSKPRQEGLAHKWEVCCCGGSRKIEASWSSLCSCIALLCQKT